VISQGQRMEIAIIGLEAVEALEADPMPRKWTIEDPKAIKALHRKN